jgi:aspartate ammonia-lyase
LRCGGTKAMSVYWLDPFDDVNKHKTYMDTYPSGTSIKNLEHFVQMAESKKFQKYDDGKSPPELYDMNNIKNA